MSLDYRVLGPIEVWADGDRLELGGARQQRLLGVLVLAEGRPVSAERLVDFVWAGDPPARARNTLRTYIARARRVLELDGDSPLVTDQHGWRLERSTDALDAVRFESLLDSARAISADPISALAIVEEALGLWRGAAFGNFADEDWCVGEAVRLDELRLVAEEERFEAMLRCGAHDDAIGDLERFIGLNPLRDRPRAQQMVALYRAGRQVDAVRAFQSYRRYLQDEIGVEASNELRTLEQRIVERDPSLQQEAPDERMLRGYQLGPVIGEGHFGRVHRATQPTLGREVAIKVVRPELSDDAEFIRRFDAEARVVARLEHPHIVPLFDYWREPGAAYLVMRYLKGGSARQLVDSQGGLSLERVGRVVEHVGSALATAHAAGVVHRDVKPANILFDEDGNAYLGDFGIARNAVPVGAIEASATAAYASPEHWSGEATDRSDVYALGAVVYELLAGRPPFVFDPSMIDATARVPSTPVGDVTAFRSDVPSAVADVLRRATAPDPTERFDTVAEFVASFRSAVGEGRNMPTAPLGMRARNPYKGLAAFDESDAADFFGRRELVEQLREVAERSRFVAVVGPSGSGKSSVVRAGLAPRMREQGAFVVSMVPGADPLSELTSALLQITPASRAERTRALLASSDDGLREALDVCLPDAEGELLLIVDQFEELFTMADEGARARFLATLAQALDDETARLRVVVTIRADFFDRPLSDDTISDLVRRNTVAVSPLVAADLAIAITSPAARVGISVEDALVAALIADAAGAAMSLPLVQYVLTALFEERDGEVLTYSAYERHGGLGGAISRRADEIYDQSSDADRDHVRRLFGRLVTPGAAGGGSRRRVRWSELEAIPPGVIDAYTDARLIAVDRDTETREPTIEIAHEALISEWPRLRRWVEGDRDSLAILRNLTDAATAWETGDRDAGQLYRGGRLSTAEEWAEEHAAELTSAEQAFLLASTEARDADRVRERRRVRRLRTLVASLAVVALVAIVAGLLAVRQSRIADDHAAEAERRLWENRTSQLVGESELARVGDDPDLAILLALAAHRTSTQISQTPRSDVLTALHEAVRASRLVDILDAGRTEIAVSPNSRTVALDHADQRNRLAIYDIETGVMHADRLLDGNVSGLAYSPDGSMIAVSFCCSDGQRSEDRPAVLLLDADTLAIEYELAGGAQSWSSAWSADGHHVLNSGEAGVRVWTVGDPVPRTIPETDSSSFAEFVPGTTSVAVTRGGTLDLHDIDTGDVIASHAIPAEASNLRVSPSGDIAAYIDGATDQVAVLDLSDGSVVDTFDAPSAEDLRFSPDGTMLSVAGNADFVRVVALDTDQTIDLYGHRSGSWRHAHTADGRLLVAMLDGGTRVWDITPAGPAELGNLTIGGRPRGGQAMDDETLLVAVETENLDGHVERHDVSSGASEIVTGFWFGQFQWPVFSPDGLLAVGFSPDERIPTIVDVATGETVTELRECDTPRAADAVNRWVLVDAWCGDDPTRTVAESGSRTGFVDADTGKFLADVGGDTVFDGAVGPPRSVASDIVAYTTHDRVVFRSASTFEVITDWRIPAGLTTLVAEFSPDGTALGISNQTGEGIVFDVEAIVTGASGDDAVRVYPAMHAGPAQRVIPVADSIVSTGRGTEVRQWDAASGDLLVEVATGLGSFVQLFAMPDNETLFYADAERVLRRFVTDADALVELARSRVQRDFTPDECERFFPDEDCPIADPQPDPEL